MTQEELESKAYQEGHKAWDEYMEWLQSETFYPKPKNPYHESTEEHRLWRLGWNNNFNGI